MILDLTKKTIPHIPEKKNLVLAACKSILLAALTTIGASAIMGKSKTFLKRENLLDTAIQFGTNFAFIGALDISRAIEHNKRIDELTKEKADSFEKRIEQEKIKTSEISAGR